MADLVGAQRAGIGECQRLGESKRQRRYRQSAADHFSKEISGGAISDQTGCCEGRDYTAEETQSQRRNAHLFGEVRASLILRSVIGADLRVGPRIDKSRRQGPTNKSAPTLLLRYLFKDH